MNRRPGLRFQTELTELISSYDSNTWTCSSGSPTRRVRPTCLQDHRGAAALTVFHSREFQDASYFLFRLYKTAFQRMPKYLEWEHDINQLNKGAEGKLTVANELAAGKEFLDRYPEKLTNLEYVRKVILSSGQTVSPAEQKSIINSLSDGKTSRADVLIKLTDSSIA